MSRKHLLKLAFIFLALLNSAPPMEAIDSMAEAYAAQAKRCCDRGEIAHAVKLYTQAIEHEEADANDELYQALLYNNLGECYRRLAEEPEQLRRMNPEESVDNCLEKAEMNIKKALVIKEEKSSSSTNFVYIARSIENLASIYKRRHQTMEAEALYRKAIAIREEKEGKGATSCASDYLAIGEILTDTRNFNEALDALKKGLALYTASSTANDNIMGICHQKIANLYLNWSKLSLAGDEYDKAVQIFAHNPATAKKYLSNLRASMPNFPQLACSDAGAELDKTMTDPNASVAAKRSRLRSMITAGRRANMPATDIKRLQNQLALYK